MSKLLVTKTPGGNEYALTNHVYINPKDATKFSSSKYLLIKAANVQLVYNFTIHSEVEAGCIGLNTVQRGCLDASLKEAVVVSSHSPKAKSFASQMSFEVGFNTTKRTDSKTYQKDKLEEVIRGNFDMQWFTVNQEFVADYSGVTLKFKVAGMYCLDFEGEPESNEKAQKKNEGILMKKTVLDFIKMKDSSIKIGGQTKQTAEVLPHFNFEQMGIGGLDKEFASIFRRAFASRVYPPDVVEKLGIQHVKGLLLHGPPGTGKTLIARKIGEMLNARPPKIVNGPEVLNKFVGQSEENIRALFAEAELEYKSKGEESELHIIIFDELDAICKERGSRSTGGTGVGDTIVNQLLSKLDGVERINNILVIGMTNRKDLIDEALLRPGRLEVHMEIGLPDEKGRIQILHIHTAKMRGNNMMDSSVNIGELAALTKNYSGAEIEGLVKSATSFALNRQIDANNLKKPDFSKIKVLREDFLEGLQDVRPAFGASEDTLENYISNGIIPYNNQFEELFENSKLFIQQVLNSSKTPMISILLSGQPGSGKTALAAKLALESGFPFIKLLSPDDYIGYTEIARVQKINKIFEDAYRSRTSIIIVDEIERHLDYVPIGPRFSNTVLQALLVLFKKQPPKGRKLLVIGTTSSLRVLKEMSFLSSCNAVLDVPSITEGEDVCRVLQAVGGFSAADLQFIAGKWSGDINIKKLLTLAETARQAEGGTLGERFIEIAKKNIKWAKPQKTMDIEDM